MRSLRTRCLHPAPEARSIRGRQGSCERPSGLSWDAGKRVRAPSGSRKAPAASTCAEGAFNPRPAGLLRKALGPFVGCREAGSSPVGVQGSPRCLPLRRRRVQSEAGRAPAKGPGLSWDAGKRVRAPSGSREGPAASTRQIRPEPAAAAAASGTSWRSRTGR